MIYKELINGLETEAYFSEDNITNIFLPLLDKLVSLHSEKQKRIVCFIAAAPGTGKSTLVSFLEYLFRNHNKTLKLQSLGMDGFHRCQDYLLTHTAMVDNKEIKMVDIKGNPITFDVDRLNYKLNELVTSKTLKWPVYDRTLHNPIEDKIEVDGDIILVEGNYLLLDYPKWNELTKSADYTIYIDADIDDLKDRLITRKAKSSLSYEEAVRFVNNSDLKNAVICKTHSVAPNLKLFTNKNGEYFIK